VASAAASAAAAVVDSVVLVVAVLVEEVQVAPGNYDYQTHGHKGPPTSGSSKSLWIILGVAGVVLLLGGCFTIGGYNKPIGLQEEVKSSWAQVENQLNRRYELIPDLVAVAKKITGEEKDLYENLANARAAYSGANTLNDKAKAASNLEGALSRLLVVVERYPDFKANRNWLKLQDSIEGSMNRISVERKRYNDAVKDLNAHIKKFPGRMFAGWAGVAEAEYFKPPEQTLKKPELDLD
jgi:LemA protein